MSRVLCGYMQVGDEIRAATMMIEGVDRSPLRIVVELLEAPGGKDPTAGVLLVQVSG